MVKTVGIVSLSSGILGESYIKHELELGVRRLQKYGLKIKFMPNALKGINYIKNHPQKRADDFLEAFLDPEIDMILCAIGGDDTYRMLPYLFENSELQNSISDKIFLGFSDTTINHFMLHKLGMRTFYGQTFLTDICELGPEILPYTRKYFEELIKTGNISEIFPSEVWYEERKRFTPDQIGTKLPMHTNHGFELLQGSAKFHGKILGGCIDSMYDMFSGDRYSNMPAMCKKYGIFPTRKDWKNRILLLESSEERPSPKKYRQALKYLKGAHVFEQISGILVGKSVDKSYEKEYKKALIEIVDNAKLPIVCNINVGHALPRCIIPFEVDAYVDVEKQVIRFSG